MNSLTVNHRLPQLRGFPVNGTPSFRYERMVSGRWVACNHSRAMAIVGVWRRKGESLCVKSTEDSGTAGASRFKSSAGSQKRSALSTCDLAIHTSAQAHSRYSSAISGKLR